jgi:hypothetical protein
MPTALGGSGARLGVHVDAVFAERGLLPPAAAARRARPGYQ